MLFNSLHFLIFFPFVVVFYFIFPHRSRWILLLLSSYYFYMSWNPKYGFLLFGSTVITFLSGIFLEKANLIKDATLRKRRKKIYVALSFATNLAILFFFRYFNFAGESIEYLIHMSNLKWNIPDFKVLLPIGISFYTFQALSYTMDVYRGHKKSEKHFGKYALFVSFFPQLVAGPIEKSINLIPQFKNNIDFNYDRVKNGLLLMGWGFFKKIVIADRLALLVNTVYNRPLDFQGLELIIATVFFAFQIYCDFSAYSDIAIGAAKVMGIDLMTNFERPYFSKSIQEFWRRWHISLGGWFRDYLYFPLGGSRVAKIVKYRNIMIVFVISGLWHGASWNFVIWGFLHGIYQVTGIEFKSIKNKVANITRIDRNPFIHNLWKVFITFSLVNIAWIFFRANTFKDALYILSKIFVFNPEIIINGELYKMGLEKPDFILAIIVIVFLLMVQLLQRKMNIIVELSRRNIVLRWGLYFILIYSIIIFGVYGDNEANEFIYFKF